MLQVMVLEIYLCIENMISEYSTRTIAAPTVRRALAPAPLNNADTPSSLTILVKQSLVPLYTRSSLGFSDCICRRRRTVSNGYETYAAPIADVWAQTNCEEARINALSDFW